MTRMRANKVKLEKQEDGGVASGLLFAVLRNIFNFSSDDNVFKLTVYRNCIEMAQCSQKQSTRRPRSTLNFTNTSEATRERCNRISETRGTIKCRFPHASVKVSFIWWPDCPQNAVLNEQHSPAGREQRDIKKKKKSVPSGNLNEEEEVCVRMNGMVNWHYRCAGVSLCVRLSLLQISNYP